MMLIISMDGPQWRCDACSQLITEGLARFRPLGPDDQVEVLTVHKTCTKNPMIETLLPSCSSRPLQQVLQQLADTLPLE